MRKITDSTIDCRLRAAFSAIVVFGLIIFGDFSYAQSCASCSKKKCKPDDTASGCPEDDKEAQIHPPEKVNGNEATNNDDAEKVWISTPPEEKPHAPGKAPLRLMGSLENFEAPSNKTNFSLEPGRYYKFSAEYDDFDSGFGHILEFRPGLELGQSLHVRESAPGDTWSKQEFIEIWNRDQVFFFRIVEDDHPGKYSPGRGSDPEFVLGELVFESNGQEPPAYSPILQRPELRFEVGLGQNDDGTFAGKLVYKDYLDSPEASVDAFEWIGYSRNPNTGHESGIEDGAASFEYDGVTGKLTEIETYTARAVFQSIEDGIRLEVFALDPEEILPPQLMRTFEIVSNAQGYSGGLEIDVFGPAGGEFHSSGAITLAATGLGLDYRLVSGDDDAFIEEGIVTIDEIETRVKRIHEVTTKFAFPGESEPITQSHNVNTYALMDWGEALLESVEDPSGLNLVTTYGYYEDHTDPSATPDLSYLSYGRTKWINYPDGSWKFFEYTDASGSLTSQGLDYPLETIEYSPWGNNTADPSIPDFQPVTANCVERRTSTFTWSNLSDETYNSGSGSYTIIAGVPVAYRYDAPRSGFEQYTVNERYTSQVSTKGETELYMKPFDPATAPRDEILRTGLPKTIRRPNNIMEAYEYSWGVLDDPATAGGEYTFPASAPPTEPPGDARREIVVSSSMSIGPHQSRITRLFNEFGDLAQVKEEQDDGSGGWDTIGLTTHEYDGRNRLVATYKNGRLDSSITYQSDHNWTEVNEFGWATSTLTDSSGRTLSRTQGALAPDGNLPAIPAITTSYSYRKVELDNSTLEESTGNDTFIAQEITVTESGGGATRQTVSARDLAGRVVYSIDEQDRKIKNHYLNGGRTHLIEEPGPFYTLRENFLDGRLKSISIGQNFDGATLIDATILQEFAYEIEEPVEGSGYGNIKTTTYNGGATSLRRTDQITDYDGRIVVEQTPAPPGQTGYTTKRYFYIQDLDSDPSVWLQPNSMRIERSGQSDEIVRYYTHDLDQIAATGIDVDGGGLTTDPTAGTDRGSFIDRVIEEDAATAGKWWRKETVTQPVDSTVIQTITRTLLRDPAPGVIQETIEELPSGETITRTVTANLQTGKRIVTTQSSNQAAPSQEVYRNGLLSSREPLPSQVSIYQYDGLARLESVTDVASGAILFEQGFNGNHQLAWRRDGANPREDYTYIPNGSQNAGQIQQMTYPDGSHVIYNLYDDQGRVREIRGNAQYPVDYDYNAYGELSQLTTYRELGVTPSTTTWHYDDASGVLTSKEYDDSSGSPGPTVAYEYWLNRKLKRRTWARGETTDYTYDPNSADLTLIDYSDPNTADVAYNAYDRLGRPTDVADASGQRAITYHANGNVDDETWIAASGDLGGITVSSEFDPLASTGRRTRTSATLSSINHYTVDYLYDSQSRLEAVIAGNSGSISYDYSDPSVVNSNVKASRFYSQNIAPTGPIPYGTEAISQIYKHDDQERVTAVNLIAETPTKRVVSAQSYGYDTAMNRRTRRTTTDGSYWDYGYNTRGELNFSQKRIPGEVLRGHTFTYDYDDIGNRKSPAGMESGGDDSGNGRRQFGYTVNEWNQATNIQNPGTVEFFGKRRDGDLVTVTYAPPGTPSPPSATVDYQGDFFRAAAFKFEMQHLVKIS